MARRSLRPFTLAAAIAALVTAANGSQGAYFSQSWGWVALAFLVPTTLVLILGHARVPGPLRIAYCAVTCALAAWIALTSIWSISSAASLREVERMLVYVAVSFAIALVLRRGDVAAVLAGVVGGVTIVSSYALATRLFPDRIDVYSDPTLQNRLAAPLGFPNALGVLAAVGLLVAVGLGAQSRCARSAAAVGFVVPVLAATVYFSFSRGAWAAWLVAFVVMVVVDPRRQLTLASSLLVAVPVGACLLVASKQEALTTKTAGSADAATQGHRLAFVVLVAAVGSALAAFVAHRATRRLAFSPSVVRKINLALVGCALAGALAIVVAIGGPSRGVSHVRASFGAHPAGYDTDLNSRLFNAYGTGRSEIWAVAWDDFRQAPLVGEGAGSFEYSWYENRRSPRIVRDAHSLYLETAGELGLVGLALLVAALSLPVAAALRARRSRFAATGLAAIVAWGLASAVDWHWEMVGLTVTALIAGSVGLLAVERARAPRGLTGTPNGVLVVASVALSVAAVWSLVGNQALFAGQEAVAREDWVSAVQDGRRARTLLFWSFEPDLVLGDASAGSGDRAGAVRAYRRAVSRDPRNWAAWLRLAQVERGRERSRAYARVHELNPRGRDLPGEGTSALG